MAKDSKLAELQRQLINWGYLAPKLNSGRGADDGLMGPKTLEAIKKAQLEGKLDQNNKIINNSNNWLGYFKAEAPFVKTGDTWEPNASLLKPRTWNYTSKNTPSTLKTSNNPFKTKDEAIPVQLGLINLGYLPKLNTRGRTNADGYFYENSQAAYAKAQKDGYTWNGKSFVKAEQKPKLQPKPSSTEESSSFWDRVSRVGNMLINRDAPYYGNALQQQISVLLAKEDAERAKLFDASKRKAFVVPKVPRDRNGNITGNCAAYVNRTLKDNGFRDTYGNAYQMEKINGFRPVYNGFNSIDDLHGFDVSNMGKTEAIDYLMDKIYRPAADDLKTNFDHSQLNQNHAYSVNMYYNKTPHAKDFYEAGTSTPGTHTGILYWNPEANQWRVTHEIGKRVLDDEFTSILGGASNPHAYGVTAISDIGELAQVSKPDMAVRKTGGRLLPRFSKGNTIDYTYDSSEMPKTSRQITLISWDTDGLDESQQKNLRPFALALIDKLGELQKRFNISEEQYPEFARAALGVYGKESSFGRENSAIENVARMAASGLGHVIYHKLLPKSLQTQGVRNKLIIGGPDPKFKDKFNNLTENLGIDKKLYNSVGLTLIHPEFSENPDLYTQELDTLDPYDAAYATVARLKEAYKDQGNNKGRGVSMWGALNQYNGGSNYPRTALNLGNKFNFTYKDESNHVLPEVVIYGKRK